MPTTATRSSSGKAKSAKSTSSQKSTSTREASQPRTQDAIALLKADHKLVDGMFKQFEEARTNAQKGSLAGRICAALKVHTQIEEEIFYPACRGEIDDDMLDEAKVEHMSYNHLIAEIECMRPC